jgi:hypothetical protein
MKTTTTVLNYNTQRKLEHRNAEMLQDKMYLIQLGVIPVESIQPLLHVVKIPVEKTVKVS